MKASKTVLLGLVGLVLVVGVVFATNLICNVEISKREVHLIPYGYRGPVVIFVDEPNGQPPHTDNGDIIYDIPTSGVLATQSKMPEWISAKYFYVTKDGRRIELKVVRQQSEMPDDSTYVFLRTGGGVVDGPIDTLTGKRLGQRQFTMYYVGRRSDNLDSMYRMEEAIFNKRTSEISASYRYGLSETPTSSLISAWGTIRSGCEIRRTRSIFFEINNRIKILNMKKAEVVRALGVPDETKQDGINDHLVYYIGASCSSAASRGPSPGNYVDVIIRNSDEAVRKIDVHAQ